MPQPARDQRIYAIGDIHGQSNLLDEILAKVIEHARTAAPVAEQRLVFLGDYIDRGPDSHGVVERLLVGLPAGFDADFLMGNHERMLLDALDDENRAVGWIMNGGRTTMLSYAKMLGLWHDPHSLLEGAMPERHVAFFRRLKTNVTHGDYLFVHAGIKPGVPIAEQTERDMLWIRDQFLTHPGPHEKVVVHGHTPMEAPDIGRWRIGIDTGAVFTGRLTALVLEGESRLLLST